MQISRNLGQEGNPLRLPFPLVFPWACDQGVLTAASLSSSPTQGQHQLKLKYLWAAVQTMRRCPKCYDQNWLLQSWIKDQSRVLNQKEGVEEKTHSPIPHLFRNLQAQDTQKFLSPKKVASVFLLAGCWFLFYFILILMLKVLCLHSWRQRRLLLLVRFCSFHPFVDAPPPTPSQVEMSPGGAAG